MEHELRAPLPQGGAHKTAVAPRLLTQFRRGRVGREKWEESKSEGVEDEKMEAWEGKLTFKGLSYLLATLGLELSFQDIQTHFRPLHPT